MHSLLQKQTFIEDTLSMDDDNNFSGFSFFSHGEFTLCHAIYNHMRRHKDHIYLGGASFEYDDTFLKRLGNFLKSPKSEVIILKKPQKSADHFIQKLIQKFGIENDPNPIKSMVRKIHMLYKENHKLIFICAGIDHFAPQDIQSLQEFCDTISEKYPTHKNNFFRFVFIGAAHEYALYKKFQNQDVKFFETFPLAQHDCMNAITLQNSNDDKQLEMHDKEAAALSLYQLSGRSFSGLRKIIPIYDKAFPQEDEEKQEKSRQFLTEIITGDLSQAEQTDFLARQKNASHNLIKSHQNLNGIIIKAVFILLCLIGSFFIWYGINGI